MGCEFPVFILFRDLREYKTRFFAIIRLQYPPNGLDSRLRDFPNERSVMVRTVLMIGLLAATAICSFAQLTFDRPKVEGLLPNPFTTAAARDIVVESAIGMLKDMNVNLDAEKTKKEEGILVAKPVIFTKGTLTVSQLEHFSRCPAIESQNWTRGRYTLQLVIEAVDPSHAKINVSTKIEGETQGMIGSSWTQCESKGLLEDQLLRTLLSKIQ
jgi:hypothetical protein